MCYFLMHYIVLQKLPVKTTKNIAGEFRTDITSYSDIKFLGEFIHNSLEFNTDLTRLVSRIDRIDIIDLNQGGEDQIIPELEN